MLSKSYGEKVRRNNIFFKVANLNENLEICRHIDNVKVKNELFYSTVVGERNYNTRELQ